MSSEYINNKAKTVGDPYGFDFSKLQEIAERSPEEFEEARKIILENYFSSLPEEEAERYRAAQKLFDARRDPNMDPIEATVRAINGTLEKIGDQVEESVETVRAGASSIEVATQGGAEAMKDIHATVDSMQKGMATIEHGLATLESGKIPHDKKH